MPAVLIGQTPSDIAINGDVNLTIPPATESTGAFTTGEENNGTVNIPAGAQYVRIYNAGFVKSGDDANGMVTVNGSAISNGMVIVQHPRYDRANNNVIALPAFVIVTDGPRVQYEYLA